MSIRSFAVGDEDQDEDQDWPDKSVRGVFG